MRVWCNSSIAIDNEAGIRQPTQGSSCPYMRHEGTVRDAARRPKGCDVPGEKMMDTMASTASSCAVAARILDNNLVSAADLRSRSRVYECHCNSARFASSLRLHTLLPKAYAYYSY